MKKVTHYLREWLVQQNHPASRSGREGPVVKLQLVFASEHEAHMARMQFMQEVLPTDHAVEIPYRGGPPIYNGVAVEFLGPKIVIDR